MPPRNAAQVIEESAATGATHVGIARALGCGMEIFNRWLDDYPELREAIQRGRETERASLHGALYEQAMNGNTVAGLFLLKSRHGYREGDQAEQANRVSINFTLPGAMRPEQFVIEHEQSSPETLALPRTRAVRS